MGSPVIIGHRGAPTLAPENTISSFERAVAAGVDALECDVRLTADDAIVIMHDATVDATTNGRGAVARMRLAQMQQLEARSRSAKGSSSAGTSEHIPTLTEFLDRFGPLGILLNIEIKPTGTSQLADAVARVVAERGLTAQVLFSSFDHTTLTQLQQNHPTARRAMLFPSTMMAGLAAGFLRQRHWITTAHGLGCEAVHPYWQLATHSTVQLAHDHGLRVNAWTVDDVATARKLVAAGVDGIITNVASEMRHHFPQRSLPSVT